MDVHIPKSWLVLVAFSACLAFLILFLIFQFWRSRRRNTFSPFTESILRVPGKSLSAKHEDLLSDFVCYYFIFIGCSLTLFGSLFFIAERPTRIACMVVALGGMLFCLYRLPLLMNKIRVVGLGCEGEEYTGQELNFLMLKGAYVFHDISYKYGNIDHIVVGHDKIFVIETKAYRKPANPKRSNGRLADVKFDGKKLIFPRFESAEPIEQATRHAEYLEGAILKHTGLRFPVMPVVALPGWNVDTTNCNNKSILVINPKRGKALVKWLGSERDIEKHRQVLIYIESLARSVVPKSKVIDADASKYYDFWLNRRPDNGS